MKRWLAAGLAGLAACAGGLAACDTGRAAPQPASATSRPASALLAPTPARLRSPDQAVLDDATVGLARTAGRDHLGAAEAARDQPDEVAALALYSSWGWVDASTRTWTAGSRRVDETVLLTLRAQGAQLAFEAWAADTDRAPLVGQPCPAGLRGLDACAYGTGGGRSLVVGRLDAEAFRIGGAGLDAVPLAKAQAARLPAA